MVTPLSVIVLRPLLTNEIFSEILLISSSIDISVAISLSCSSSVNLNLNFVAIYSFCSLSNCKPPCSSSTPVSCAIPTITGFCVSATLNVASFVSAYCLPSKIRCWNEMSFAISQAINVLSKSNSYVP